MIDAALLLAGLPVALRDPLLANYREIAANYVERRWEPAELNGGKFSEVVFTIVEGALSGSFAAKPAKPPNMRDACRDLEKVASDANRIGDRSLRVLIPRVLQALYEVRNNRGVGHVGGDVDPNYLDATAVYAMASWVLAELVRIFHGVSTIEAQQTVDALIERKIPLIWEIGDVRRVLDAEMDNKDQVLVLLYQSAAWVDEKNLVRWVEYAKASMFPTRVLDPLHSKRLIEYDRAQRRARISPLGVKEVEDVILGSRDGGTRSRS